MEKVVVASFSVRY